MFFKGCHKEHREATFKKYRAEIVLLLALVVFYLTLIIFTCVSIFLRHLLLQEDHLGHQSKCFVYGDSHLITEGSSLCPSLIEPPDCENHYNKLPACFLSCGSAQSTGMRHEVRYVKGIWEMPKGPTKVPEGLTSGLWRWKVQHLLSLSRDEGSILVGKWAAQPHQV